ncbi:hypothetical protein [Spongiimicrobium sp. 3-5]|uniref:hypothetical protein n=1 Tax=Spongiimicrobium sp. 3-5 TaxID=3332596 RepID=UPI0039817B39
MKKNKKTYLLLAAVLIIWGIIGFKVVNAINPSAKNDFNTGLTTKFEPKTMKAKDTFSILADYRDPFLGTLPKSRSANKKAPKTPKKAAIPEIPISYTGFITEKGSGKKIFFLTINGNQQMMTRGETVQGVKLVRGTKGSVQVQHNGRTRTIKLME